MHPRVKLSGCNRLRHGQENLSPKNLNAPAEHWRKGRVRESFYLIARRLAVPNRARMLSGTSPDFKRDLPLGSGCTLSDPH